MIKEKKKNILTVEVEVDGNVEAYDVVTNIAFSHKVLGASLSGYKEKFDKENTPFHFLKDNKKNKKRFRDILKERKK